MRRNGALSMAAALLLTATSGCGTMQNMRGQPNAFGSLPHPTRPPVPFGGVIADSLCVVNGTFGGLNVETLVFVPFALIDLPFSLVGDVITLPWATAEFISEMRNPSDRYRWPDPRVVADPEKGPTPQAETSEPGGATNLRKRE
jgi:uncharacterized protein YceK